MTDTQMITCPSCGATNRVPLDKLRAGLAPVCGRCKAPLAASSDPVIITDSNFADQVENSRLPVMVDMWAPWCGPCRYLSPIVEQLAGELAGRVRIGKMNVDENPQTSGRFQVGSIPTLLIFQGGMEVDRIIGVHPKAEILQRLHAVIG
ncbi:MAG TPA: thioredoxin [Bryobacteraceae bacterium]|nr:thioredoxin [Bryobacteraceae bacterium]